MQLTTTLVALETAGEVAVLLDLAGIAEAVSLVVRPAEALPAFTLWNDLPVTGIADGVIVEVGAVAGRRQIMLAFELPRNLDADRICDLELRAMTEKLATLRVQAHTYGECARRAWMRTVASS